MSETTTMPTPSKFTADRRGRILEALTVGASRRTAALVAGIDHATLVRWIARGSARTEGAYHDFHAAVLEAESRPRMRALGVLHQAMPDRPDLAWKFIERREPGYGVSSTQAPSGSSQPREQPSTAFGRSRASWR